MIYVSPRALALWPLLSSVLAMALSLLFGRLDPWISAIALVSGFIVAGNWARELQTENDRWTWAGPSGKDLRSIEWVIFLFVLLIALKNFTWLLYPHEHEWRTLSKTNIGDLPLHIHFIRAFAGGLHFPPINPIYTAESLRYAYGPDLFNALFESLGMPIAGHLWLIAMLATVVSLVALRAFGGWLAMAGFFFSGGLLHWPIIGAGLRDENLAWRNLFETVFLTQRGLMLVLPIGLLVLDSFEKMFTGKTPITLRRLVITSVTFGFIPFFHPHTFVALSLMIGTIVLINFKTAKEHLLLVVPTTLVSSLYFLMQTTGGGAKAAVIRWHSNWTFQSGNVIWYYLSNFGFWLFGLIAFGCWIFGSRKERPRDWMQFCGYLLIFIFFLNVIFAPWEWDNIKCLIWPALGLMALVFHAYDSKLKLETRWALAIILSYSGFQQANILSRTRPAQGYRLYRFEDIANAEAATQSLAGRARENIRMVAAPTYAHILTYLGFPRVAGYHGHLWSHAIGGWEDTKTKIEAIYRGDPGWADMLKALNATHIYFGPDEKIEFKDPNPEFRKVLRNISRIPDHEIYEVAK